MMQKIDSRILALAAALALTACGGGGGGDDDKSNTGNGTPTQTSGSVVLSGQVIDGPVAGAKVCLLSDGVQAQNAAGTAICSSETDANGNYTLTIPRNLAPGFISLVASKDSNIKLASSLGTLTQVLAAADSTNTISPATLPTVKVTHFTTADFALADTNSDGKVTESEASAYIQDFTEVRKVAAVIKAVVDFGPQSGALIGGQTPDTLALAAAAARNQPLGTSNKTADQWLADPTNKEIVASVNVDVAADLETKFSWYTWTETVTKVDIPAPVVRDNGAASLYCSVGSDEEGTSSGTLQIAVDAARRVALIKNKDAVMVGSYNATTGAVSFEEINAFAPTLTSAAGVTFYSKGYYRLNGTYNASTGSLTGTFSEETTNTWTLDSTEQVCTSEGNITATKQ